MLSGYATDGISPGKIVIFLLHLLLLSKIVESATIEASDEKDTIMPLFTPLLSDYFVSEQGITFANSFLTEIQDHFPVHIDPALVSSVAHSDIEQARLLCQSAIRDVLSEHSWVTRGQLVNDLKSGQLTVILITPDSAHDAMSVGIYSQKSGHLGIVYKPDLLKSDYEKAFLNELMSHLIIARDKRCHQIIDPEFAGLPFINKEGKIDTHLKKTLAFSLKAGMRSVKKMKASWQKRDKNSLLFLSAVKHYTPQTSIEPLQYFGGEAQLREALRMGIFKQHGDKLEPGPAYPKNAHSFHAKRKGNYFISYRTNNTQSLRGRITGFFADVERYPIELYQPDGPYHSMSEDRKLAEYATFVAQLPIPLLNLFFKDFSQYIGNYLQYCDTTNVQSKQNRERLFSKSQTMPQKIDTKVRWASVSHHKHAYR